MPYVPGILTAALPSGFLTGKFIPQLYNFPSVNAGGLPPAHYFVMRTLTAVLPSGFAVPWRPSTLVHNQALAPGTLERHTPNALCKREDATGRPPLGRVAVPKP